MSSVREHLAGFHSAASSHHHEMHAVHKAIAAAHEKMSKGKPAVDGETHNAELSAHHSALSDLHKKHAEYHASMGTACQKGMDTVELNKTMPLPEGFSRITPDIPVGVRAVTRPGQRSVEATVDPMFQHLVKTTDDSMDAFI